MKRLRLPFVARRSSTATVFSGRTMLMRLFIKRHFAAYTPGMCMSNCWRTHVSARRIANPLQLAKLPHKPSCPTSRTTLSWKSESIGEEQSGARPVARRRGGTADRHQRRADPGAANRDLRHGRPHLQVGRMGAEDDPGAYGDRARIRG